MTQEQIIEGNKLIAEFMGFKYYPHNSPELENSEPGWKKYATARFAPKIIGKSYLCRSHRDLKYHKSWDWIMPVCRRLDFLAENKEIKWSYDYGIMCDKLDGAVTTAYSIMDVFEIVIDFIEWYNTNKG